MNRSTTTTRGGIADEARRTAGNVAPRAWEGAAPQGEGATNPLPDLAARAAEGIERLARYLENKSVADVVRSVESFARREPALFLGGALAMGMMAGRFLKSSGHRMRSASGGAAQVEGSSGFAESYDYGYEGEYGGDDFLTSDDLQDDWDVMEEPIAFEAEARGFGGGSPSHDEAEEMAGGAGDTSRAGR